MANNREMVDSVRALARSSRQRVLADFVGLESLGLESLYGGGDALYDNGTCLGSVTFKIDPSTIHDVRLLFTPANCNEQYKAVLTVEEGETALVFFKRAVALLKRQFRAEPQEGEVKAFIHYGPMRLFWLCLPADSSEIGRAGDEYFHIEMSGRFTRVFTSETEFTLVDDSTATPSNVYYNGQLYAAEVCVTIYHNSIPFTEQSARVPEWIARRRYQTVTVDGELRYITLERPGNAFFGRGLHGYSTRIEAVVPEENLFQKGKVDLYAKRSNDETPFLGWELEACTDEGQAGTEDTAIAMKERLPFLVMAKTDSSIRPTGFETVSVPATLDFWKETALADTMDAMRVAPYNMRSFKHSSCGFHVHVSRAALSVLDLQKMERFMHNPANRSFLEKVAGRKANTYQNYTDQLFNGRKALAAVGDGELAPIRNTIDDIIYFVNSVQTRENLRTDKVNLSSVQSRYRGWNGSSQNMYLLFDSYCGDNVSYERLNRVSGGLFNIARGQGVPVAQQELDWPTAHKAYIIALCNASPFFRWKFDEFFDSIRDELPSITYSPSPEPSSSDWRSSYKRSTAPYGRKNSYRASRGIKGPVGKGAQRYDVLNTSNTNTVEFRLFKGTMNPVTIFRYLEFVDALTRFVAMTSATDQGVNYTTFVNWIMNDAFNVSRYENLVAFLVENKFQDRKFIKRRYLPEAKPEDGDLNVTPKPKPASAEDAPSGPLYSLSTLDSSAVAEVVTSPTSVDDDDYDPEPEYDEEQDGCDCDDCRRMRGEDVEDYDD